MQMTKIRRPTRTPQDRTFATLTLATILLAACDVGGPLGEPRAACGTSAESPQTTFFSLPQEPFRAPMVTEVPLPAIGGVDAIWGALGSDARGRILIGVSGHGGNAPHLLAFDPAAGHVADLGTPVGALEAQRLRRDGETQNKIHSRFVRGADGCAYFATSDETGESEVPEIAPRWGGHLWRLGDGDQWEHVLAAREGLIAVGSGGSAVFALGYWGHVLHAYRIDTGARAHVRVGAFDGHVSRNLIVDTRGLAYVPRLSRSGQTIQASLAAYDRDLRELGEQPMPYYLQPGAAPSKSHGIVGLARLLDGSIVFTTHIGRLYQLKPREEGPAELIDRGWFHPDGEAYAPGLFTFTGQRLVAGLARRKGGGHEWVVHDLGSGVAAAYPLPLETYRGLLLYGSETRDKQGSFYVGGWVTATEGGQRPILFRPTLN